MACSCSEGYELCLDLRSEHSAIASEGYLKLFASCQIEGWGGIGEKISKLEGISAEFIPAISNGSPNWR